MSRRKLLGLSLNRAREPQGVVRHRRFHGPATLINASPGRGTWIPNRWAAPAKSRRLIASARPFAAASSTNASLESRSCGRHSRSCSVGDDEQEGETSLNGAFFTTTQRAETWRIAHRKLMRKLLKKHGRALHEWVMDSNRRMGLRFMC